jgi:hypothetical protein
LAHRFLTRLSTPESAHHARAIEQSTDPVYGDGFRRVCAVADAIGFPRLVEAFLTSKQLPMV